MVKKNRAEKIWTVSYATVRRHSRVLYVPLDPVVVRLHDLKKGDTIKICLLEVIKQPRDEVE